MQGAQRGRRAKPPKPETPQAWGLLELWSFTGNVLGVGGGVTRIGKKSIREICLRDCSMRRLLVAGSSSGAFLSLIHAFRRVLSPKS